MPKNSKYSTLDIGQIKTYSFDEDNDAQRVVIVGSEGLTFNFDKVDLKMPEVQQSQVVVKELEIKEIEKQVIVPFETVKIVEVPTIVKEVQVIEVEKVIEKIVYKEVQIPVVTKEIQILEIPKYLEKVSIQIVPTVSLWYKVAMGVMLVITLGSILIHVK